MVPHFAIFAFLARPPVRHFTIFAKLARLSGFRNYHLPTYHPAVLEVYRITIVVYMRAYLSPYFPIYRTFRHTVLPFCRFIALEIYHFTILACPSVCHCSHNRSDLGYPTGSDFPGGMGYSSRRCIIVGRNTDEVCITPRVGPFLAVCLLRWGILLGWVCSLIFVTLAVWISLLVFRIPTSYMGWVIQAVLIIVVGELSHRFWFHNWIHIILLCRVNLLGCITPVGWLVLIGWFAFSGRLGCHIAWDISYWFG